jgi:hypothetical protein
MRTIRARRPARSLVIGVALLSAAAALAGCNDSGGGSGGSGSAPPTSAPPSAPSHPTLDLTPPGGSDLPTVSAPVKPGSN